VQILAQAYWPQYLARDVTLPPVVREALDIFERFYKEAKPNRTLLWIPSRSTATVRSLYPRCRRVKHFEALSTCSSRAQ